MPLHYYIILSAALVLGLVVLGMMMRMRKKQYPSQSPYIEALKLMVDGHRESAFSKLQEAVKSGSAPTDAYIRLGNLLRERGETSRALQIHQGLTVKTNLTKAEKVELFMNLAEDYALMGNSQKSVEVLESAIRSFHIKDPDVMLTIARHHHVLGNGEKAYDALKEARKLGGIGDREIALYLSSSAEALVEKGELKEARKVLQRALKHDPKCAPCLMIMGNLAETSKDLNEAVSRWKEVALLSPQLADTVLHKLGTTLYEQGRFGDIEKIYKDVRAQRVGDEAATLALAAFYRKQGRGDDAIQLLEEYLAVYPDSVRVSLLLTSFYAKYRDPETLERFLDKAIKDPWLADHFECRSCHLKSDFMRWHCRRCGSFDSFSTNHEV